jgi:hypothetical protein
MSPTASYGHSVAQGNVLEVPQAVISHTVLRMRILLPLVGLARRGGDHCIWSSAFEKAALSLSAFFISSQLT